MDKIERKTREKQMQEHIQAWQNSKLTQQEYCSRNQLSFNTFYYWLKKIKEREQSLGAGFVALRFKDQRPSTVGSVEIHYPNGVRLSVPVSTDLRLVSRLIRLI